jgi:hypothetical protein
MNTLTTSMSQDPKGPGGCLFAEGLYQAHVAQNYQKSPRYSSFRITRSATRALVLHTKTMLQCTTGAHVPQLTHAAINIQVH